jgi:hypothetical protein
MIAILSMEAIAAAARHPLRDGPRIVTRRLGGAHFVAVTRTCFRIFLAKVWVQRPWVPS